MRTTHWLSTLLLGGMLGVATLSGAQVPVGAPGDLVAPAPLPGATDAPVGMPGGPEAEGVATRGFAGDQADLLANQGFQALRARDFQLAFDLYTQAASIPLLGRKYSHMPDRVRQLHEQVNLNGFDATAKSKLPEDRDIEMGYWLGWHDSQLRSQEEVQFDKDARSFARPARAPGRITRDQDPGRVRNPTADRLDRASAAAAAMSGRR